MTTDNSRPDRDSHASGSPDAGGSTGHKVARSGVLFAPLLLALIGVVAVCLALILI